MFAFGALLFGSVHTTAIAAEKKVTITRCVQTKNCPKAKRTGIVKRYPKKKTKPLRITRPSIGKDYKPSFFSLHSTELAIEAYKDCMYGTPASEDKIERALLLNLAYRDDANLHGSPDKIGREVCLADILGLKRYQTQAEIDRAKGSELFPISTEFIEFPDDTGNYLPPERRLGTWWVKEYLETLARDLHAYLLENPSEEMSNSTPLLRVNSLVRSLAAQGRQVSSAKCKNEICSTHLTGSTVDISNYPVHVSPLVRQWLRERLLADRKEGKIIMIEEFFHPHFHIFVIPPQYLASEKTKATQHDIIVPSKPPSS